MRRNDVLKLFGERLKQFRHTKAITQEDLASSCQLDRTYVSGLERGVRNPSLTCLVKIARGLGVEIGDLTKDLEAVGNEQ